MAIVIRVAVAAAAAVICLSPRVAFACCFLVETPRGAEASMYQSNRRKSARGQGKRCCADAGSVFAAINPSLVKAARKVESRPSSESLWTLPNLWLVEECPREGLRRQGPLLGLAGRSCREKMQRPHLEQSSSPRRTPADTLSHWRL